MSKDLRIGDRVIFKGRKGTIISGEGQNIYFYGQEFIEFDCGGCVIASPNCIKRLVKKKHKFELGDRVKHPDPDLGKGTITKSRPEISRIVEVSFDNGLVYYMTCELFKKLKKKTICSARKIESLNAEVKRLNDIIENIRNCF